MIEDPIVEEIHRIRQQMLHECGGDLGKLIEFIRTQEQKDKDRLVGPEEFKKLMSRPEEPVGQR